MSRLQKCQHFKPAGGRCGSPAMKGKRFCYFHYAARKQHPHRVARAPLVPDWPVIEDPRSVQIALNQVLNAILHRSVDRRTAGQLLNGLQSASASVARKREENCANPSPLSG